LRRAIYQKAQALSTPLLPGHAKARYCGAMTPNHPSDWAETTEREVLSQALKLAPRHGWTWAMAKAAGAAAGLSEGETELLLPRGPQDLAALLSRSHDARALAMLEGVDPSALKIRARIGQAVTARIDAAAVDEPAVRRWTGFLALPANIALGVQLAWESADLLWRWAGDEATDENHYSKRAILAGILTGAIAIRLSGGRAAALSFVERRIGNVMAYEKWKASTRLRPSDMLAGGAAALGRMRFGAPRREPT
jgi:ubiquinone biosynthesis protein COQ9